jgi:hypothetical protein
VSGSVRAVRGLRCLSDGRYRDRDRPAWLSRVRDRGTLKLAVFADQCAHRPVSPALANGRIQAFHYLESQLQTEAS